MNKKKNEKQLPLLQIRSENNSLKSVHSILKSKCFTTRTKNPIKLPNERLLYLTFSNSTSNLRKNNIHPLKKISSTPSICQYTSKKENINRNFNKKIFKTLTDFMRQPIKVNSHKSTKYKNKKNTNRFYLNTHDIIPYHKFSYDYSKSALLKLKKKNDFTNQIVYNRTYTQKLKNKFKCLNQLDILKINATKKNQKEIIGSDCSSNNSTNRSRNGLTLIKRKTIEHSKLNKINHNTFFRSRPPSTSITSNTNEGKLNSEEEFTRNSKKFIKQLSYIPEITTNSNENNKQNFTRMNTQKITKPNFTQRKGENSKMEESLFNLTHKESSVCELTFNESVANFGKSILEKSFLRRGEYAEDESIINSSKHYVKESKSSVQSSSKLYISGSSIIDKLTRQISKKINDLEQSKKERISSKFIDISLHMKKNIYTEITKKKEANKHNHYKTMKLLFLKEYSNDSHQLYCFVHHFIRERENFIIYNFLHPSFSSYLLEKYLDISIHNYIFSKFYLSKDFSNHMLHNIPTLISNFHEIKGNKKNTTVYSPKIKRGFSKRMANIYSSTSLVNGISHELKEKIKKGIIRKFSSIVIIASADVEFLNTFLFHDLPEYAPYPPFKLNIKKKSSMTNRIGIRQYSIMKRNFNQRKTFSSEKKNKINLPVHMIKQTNSQTILLSRNTQNLNYKKKYINENCSPRLNLNQSEKLFLSPLKYAESISQLDKHSMKDQTMIKLQQNVFNKNSFISRTTMIKSQSVKNVSNEEKIFILIKDGSYDEFKDLCSRYKPNLEIKDHLGNSPLNLAVQAGWIKIVTYLIHSGVNVNTTNKLGNTPLHHAFYDKNYPIADLLIQNGANEKAQNNIGLTPWQCIDF